MWTEEARNLTIVVHSRRAGYLGAQVTFYVGTLKGMGRIYQQTFIDTYTKVARVKLYDRKNALVAADMLNHRVLPFCEEQGVSFSPDGKRHWSTAPSPNLSERCARRIGSFPPLFACLTQFSGDRGLQGLFPIDIFTGRHIIIVEIRTLASRRPTHHVSY
jgi:hypothetical protein